MARCSARVRSSRQGVPQGEGNPQRERRRAPTQEGEPEHLRREVAVGYEPTSAGSPARSVAGAC